MTALVAWPLALLASVLLVVAVLAATPFVALVWVAVRMLQSAARLLGREPTRPEVGDDTLAMLRAHEDQQWRAYLSHPAARAAAARHVRRDIKGDG